MKESLTALLGQGVQWLLTAVDKEKQEKACQPSKRSPCLKVMGIGMLRSLALVWRFAGQAWLAKKFEEKCAEVQALHEELQRARALLEQRGLGEPAGKLRD